LGDKNTKKVDNITTVFPIVPVGYPSNYFKNYASWNFTIQCDNYKRVESVQFCPDFNSKKNKKKFFFLNTK